MKNYNEFYVCPNHQATSGYESCCPCGGWRDYEEKRLCSENIEFKKPINDDENKIFFSKNYVNRCECGKFVTMEYYIGLKDEALFEVKEKILNGKDTNGKDIYIAQCECGNMFVAKTNTVLENKIKRKKYKISKNKKYRVDYKNMKVVKIK